MVIVWTNKEYKLPNWEKTLRIVGPFQEQKRVVESKYREVQLVGSILHWTDLLESVEEKLSLRDKPE